MYIKNFSYDLRKVVQEINRNENVKIKLCNNENLNSTINENPKILFDFFYIKEKS
ncbi:MAG: hypothetical protein ACTSQP_16530 [Promethearchaeota archaeon]